MTKHALTAVIYNKRGRVLSVGQNSYTKSHPRMATLGKQTGNPFRIYLHAEVAAILRCHDLSKADSIRIFRYNAAGKAANARPCDICQSAIQKAGIRKVFHT